MIKKLLNKSDFIKSSFTLIFGTVLAQLIPIALQPILRRIYTPEEFGLFAVYLSLIGMVVVAANLRYESTIVLPEDDDNASNLIVGGFFISLVFSLVFFILLFLFGDNLIQLLSLPKDISKWLYVLPFSVFVISCSRILNFWLTRKKAFKASAVNKVARRSSEGVIQTVGNTFLSSGLIIGNIIGDTVNLFVSILQSIKYGLNFKAYKISITKQQLKKYIDFPKYSTIPTLLNSISLFLPVIIINQFYSQEVTGYFDLSRQMLALPLALVSMAVSQVLIQKVVEYKQNRKKITKLVTKIAFTLLGMSAIGILIIELFGIELFTFIFGDEWEFSGRITQVLIFSYAIKFVVSPLTSVFIGLEKIKISSVWQVCYFLIICCLYFFKDYSIEEFLLLYITIDIIAYAIYYLLLNYICVQHDKSTY
jgi:O-antigen/teichoic acid export membrane protein